MTDMRQEEITQEEVDDLVRRYPELYDGSGLTEALRVGFPHARPEVQIWARMQMMMLRRTRRSIVEDRLVKLLGDMPARRILAEAGDDAIGAAFVLNEPQLRRWATERLMAVGGGTAYAAEAARASRVAVEMLADAAADIRKLTATTNDATAVAQVLLGRLTDPTHLSVAEAARLRGVSTKTIRNWIKRGTVTLEQVPGTRRNGIPVDQLTSGWVSREAAERHLRRGRR